MGKMGSSCHFSNALPASIWKLRWPGDSQRESGRFARIDSQKNPIFMTFERFARIASNLQIAMFETPEARFAKKGVQFGNPETIRESQAIRANLRIDSRESGHLSLGTLLSLVLFVRFFGFVSPLGS